MTRYNIRDAALVVLLGISLAINAYLLTRKPGSRRLTHAASRSASILPSNPIGLVPSDIDPSRSCAEQLTEVEARFAAVKPEIERRLSPKEKFEAATGDFVRDSAREPEVKIVVDTLFADAPDDFGWDLECRGSICRVEIHKGSAPYDWPQRLQDQELESPYESIMFEGASAYLLFHEPNAVGSGSGG
jgi:hypothetical protein